MLWEGGCCMYYVRCVCVDGVYVDGVPVNG